MCTGWGKGAREVRRGCGARIALGCLRPCTDPESEGSGTNVGAMLLFGGLGGVNKCLEDIRVFQ